jgi:hypothetical protein
MPLMRRELTSTKDRSISRSMKGAESSTASNGRPTLEK